MVNTNTKAYTIVGIIERPAYNVEPYSAPGYTFITYLNDNNSMILIFGSLYLAGEIKKYF